MNTEFTEQPFNLETALKHPEWVYFRNGEKPLEWHWFEKAKHPYPIRTVDKNGNFDSMGRNGNRFSLRTDDFDLILRMPYKEIYVRILENGKAYWGHRKPCVENEDIAELIACVPVKIPLI